MFFAILFLFIAYIIGSFPSALIVGKLARGIDIREHGSGNLGSTNAIRVLGKPLGFTVFFLDVLKGVICAGGARILYEVLGYEIDFSNFDAFSFVLFKPFFYALPGILGHMFPIFAGFKGGKAVATSLGVTLVFTPLAGVLCVIVFGITIKISGYSSLGSILAILTVLITVIIQKFFLSEYLGNIGLELLIFYIAISFFMIFKHRKNIVRIFKGTENSFKKKKDSSNDTNQTKI